VKILIFNISSLRTLFRSTQGPEPLGFFMKKVVFFIDGFNFYHSILFPPKFHKYKWLDFNKLASLFIQRNEQIEEIYFFTALTNWNRAKVDRHQILINALESVGIKTVYGQFKPKDIECKICKRVFKKHEEKQTDVNIAVYLFKCAIEDRFDRAYILTADSDLKPAITILKDQFPNKEIYVMFPLGRKSNELKDVCDQHIKIKEKHLKSCIFPCTLVMDDGTQLIRPPSWS